jgi:hypothetical protein
MTDTAWHTLGFLLAAAGLLVLLRGFVHDRSRGRRRCPRCWYSMDGVPESESPAGTVFVCPECGHGARSLKALHKTRRRVRMLPLTGLLFLMGYSLWCVPRVKDEGSRGFIPTAALIAAVPYPELDYLAPRPEWYFAMQRVLRKRTETHGVWGWQALLWDWRVRLRFALESRDGVPAGVSGSVAALDRGVIGAFTAIDQEDLRSRLLTATGLEFNAPEGPLIWPVPGPLPASRTLDFVCNDMRFRGVRWLVRDGAVELLPRGTAPDTFLQTYTTGGLSTREVGDAVIALVSPDEWFVNGGDVSVIDGVGSRLFVVAPAVEQVRIGALIDGLRRAGGEPVRLMPRMPEGPYSDDMPRRMLGEVVIYDVSGLGAPPHDKLPAVALTGMAFPTTAHLIAMSLWDLSDDWLSNGGDAASIHVVGSLLVVSAPPDMHARVSRRLETLRPVR